MGMLAHFPSNCSLISTSLTRCVVSNGTTFTEQVCRCVPNMEAHSIRLYALGHTSKVLYRPACITSGVNTREVHEYNVSTGWALPDERTEEEREAESIRTSVSRSVRMVRELAACNQWQFFVTITLSPKHWENRYTPDGLQDVIKLMAKRWRRKRTNGSAYCPGFKYLLIPEMHKDGAIHLHGFVSCMPSKDCVPYTLDEVNGEQNLPREICNKVRAGQEVYHCNEWEQFFGFNTIEPISDLDKASSYVVKYVSKEIGKTPFKTRYWCSRGLSRATLVGKFYFSDEYLVEPQLEFYNQSLASMAAVTKSNFLMHRAKGINDASEVVNRILSAYISSSEETIFGNAFFEPIAIAVSGGQKAITEGVDITVDKNNTIYSIAVKSGTSVYNGDSKKKQIDNFLAASKRAQQAHKAFMPVVGYGYGKRNPKKEKFYKELAGKDFWEWLTGDPNFYTKIISYMGTKPEEFTSTFENSYANAQNRMLRDFTKDYCKDDGSIDWDKLIKFNSGD